MKSLFSLFLCIALVWGCSKTAKEGSVISKSKFVDVLVDIHMADATLAVKGYRIHTDSAKIRLFYNDVLVKHGVTQKQIQNTLEYYSLNPRGFEKIYEQVSEKVMKLEEQYKDSMNLKE